MCSPVLSITRRLTFCAGHRLLGHEGHCAQLHGHNYVVEVTVSAEQLNAIGMVTDFKVIKQRLGTWLDENWDHGFLLHEADTAAREWLEAFEIRPGERQKVYVLPINPTAEGMALYLLESVSPTLFGDLPGVEVTRIRVWETESCFAEATKTVSG